MFIDPPTPERPGVQQILLLPRSNKACILCNWTVTFLTLPELSPVLTNVVTKGCNWVGGVDLNLPALPNPGETTASTILFSLNKKIRVVRVGDEARGLKTIDFAGSTISVRRDAFACVADAHSYALLDVERQLKIPLFPISSLDDSQTGHVGGRAETISGTSETRTQRSNSSVPPATFSPEDRGHSRSTSLGTFMSGIAARAGQTSPSRGLSPTPGMSPSRRRLSPTPSDKPLPPPPQSPTKTKQASQPPVRPVTFLKPHIASPTPQEFLLVTGTENSEPGVGLFVNLEGDVTRSTLEFDRYPLDLVVIGRGTGTEISEVNAEDDEEGYVLATMVRETDADAQPGIEIQRWDLDPSEMGITKSWLPIPTHGVKVPARVGIRMVMQSGDVSFEGVVDKLRLKRFRPSPTPSKAPSTHSQDSRTATSLERVSKENELFEPQDNLSDGGIPEGYEDARNEEEYHFARRLGGSSARVTAWTGDKIWWIAKNPQALQLDAALSSSGLDIRSPIQVDTRPIVETINSLRGREAKSEAEFVSFGYIRQRAGLLLVIHFSTASSPLSDVEIRVMEEALQEGSLDPRVILALIPQIRNEVVGGRTGIWVHGGVRDTAEQFISSRDVSQDVQMASHRILQFLRRFLTAWRRKKGFGSIADEKEVFRSVDAALLVVLLELDKASPRASARVGSTRADLNDVVDHGVDCFDRAVSILESYRRLYVLSRLYQSKKLAGEVLATWRRIIEGEVDEGGEFTDGEQRVREYLTNVRNAAVVQDFGIWLAARNPKLGVQVFADDKSRVKFEPAQVVEILRRGAPAAVKEYLEYLVFGKNHTEYVNELITYYLDNVIEQLESSQEAKDILAATYEQYRALQAPKPDYRQFITDNAFPAEWWQSRLRLLQLLGGSHGSPESQYDVASISSRIEPFQNHLVPEVIILAGKQSRHQDAIKLLTHGLGDYDTAINYCLLGGSSIYQPMTGVSLRRSATLPPREEQSRLFTFLLAEFLQLEDIGEQIEQTSNLLERFGSWFDVMDVLRVIPDTWSVGIVGTFLVSALRRMVAERSETAIAKALSGAENLKTNAELIGKITEIGPKVEAEA